MAERMSVNFDFGWRFFLGQVPDPNRVCGKIEKGVNYGTGGVEHDGVEDAPTCCDLCAQSTVCVAWDWNPTTKQCWTKPDATGPVPANRYSGVIPADPIPPPARQEFDDSSWELVDAPHDALILQPYSESNSASQGFLARNVSWYRKHFTVPDAWKSENDAVFVYFEGVFHVSTVWLNGEQLAPPHLQGYTSFAVRLDNATGFEYGKEMVLAVYVDASFGDGWWYEGGGLFRHIHLVHLPLTNLAIDASGVFPWSTNVSTNSAILHVQTTATTLPSPTFTSSSTLSVSHTLRSIPDGTVVSTFSSPSIPTPPPNTTATSNISHELRDINLWSIHSPQLYSLETVISDDSTQSVVDNVTQVIGIRSFSFDADHGVFLNGENVKFRGFCDHENWAFGAALPDRFHLFRLQSKRFVGGNAMRSAHNPPMPARLDFADALGVAVLDENRDFGGTSQQGGTTPESIQDELQDLRDMIYRDRHHPSIFAFSLCNEVGCNNESATPVFADVGRAVDWSRPITLNNNNANPMPVEITALNIQGFSHRSGEDFDNFHKANPNKPTMATECCSSLSQRRIPKDACPKPRPSSCTQGCHVDCFGSYTGDNTTGFFYNSEIADSLLSQVAISDYQREYVGGTFVWSGFQYRGESRGFPQTSKCRGVVADVAGFELESSYVLQSWWMANKSTSDPGRPPLLPSLQYSLFIVEAWVPGFWAAAGKATREINVYSNAPFVELWVNGKLAEGGERQSIPFFGHATFPNVTFTPGNLTAVARDMGGAIVKTYSTFTPSTPTSLRLSLDAPSPQTLTGAHLLSDGEDVALVRVEIVDRNGVLCEHSPSQHNITISVESGPGYVVGVHSGNVSSHIPPSSPTSPDSHGLLRGVIRSNLDASSPWSVRSILCAMNLETAMTKIDCNPTPSPPPPIIIKATADGLESATLSIPVSLDATKHSPLAVARNLKGRGELEAE